MTILNALYYLNGQMLAQDLSWDASDGTYGAAGLRAAAWGYLHSCQI